ncbi:putative 26S proteasome regulatory subunit p28 [Tritrichomonas foetus]|uniref:26S proteasome regulatory subunit p28 n=1 Tax=Tritrichomonas foetus TaxID=1144522 RepID=A0A1J4L2K3_9EUKA|nr:putative 26S proteasome regulatory subunit p28 [Tritrichomonas foetus]|eukprot:OHT16196.1 putative 26S proteasome regulatory subunit p28 [Tritrichomonas foetus]
MIFNNIPLHFACLNENSKILKILLQYIEKDQLNIENKLGQTPISHILQNPNLDLLNEVIHFLGEENLNHPFNNQKQTLLHLACQNRSLEAVQTLLSYKSLNINETDQAGQTCLMISVKLNLLEMTKLLLKFPGIDVNISDKNNQNVLHIACNTYNSIEIVKLLLNQKEIEINHRDKENNPPLFYAFEENQKNIVQLLIKQPNIDLNINSKNFIESMNSPTLRYFYFRNL